MTAASDYWNRYLEHNHLRAPRSGQGPETNAGAFLAWMLEGAGDILRESALEYPALDYMLEKWNRINTHLDARDWRNNLSPQENIELTEIRERIRLLPVETNFESAVKGLLIAIAHRFPTNVKARLDHLKKFLVELDIKCGWCGKNLGKKFGAGTTGTTTTICDDCKQKHFGGYINMNPRRAPIEIKFDPKVYGQWQKLMDRPSKNGGRYISWLRQHKLIEERRGYPFSKTSLVQISGQGNIWGITALTVAHSIFPVPGLKSPVKGERGLHFYRIAQSANSFDDAMRKAKSLMLVINKRFEKVTRDTKEVKNPVPPKSVDYKKIAETLQKYPITVSSHNKPKEIIYKTREGKGRPIKIYVFNPTSLEMRLADKAMDLSRGDVEGVVNWLKSIGARDIYITDNKQEANLTGPSGIRVGLLASDPVTCAVQLGFATAGQFWPQVYPGLLHEVNQRWKEQGKGYSKAGKR